jgi:hypothetical protein
LHDLRSATDAKAGVGSVFALTGTADHKLIPFKRGTGILTSGKRQGQKRPPFRKLIHPYGIEEKHPLTQARKSPMRESLSRCGPFVGSIKAQF